MQLETAKVSLAATSSFGLLVGHDLALCVDALVHRDRAKLRGLLPRVDVEQGRRVFFVVLDKLLAQPVYLRLPDAHDELLGHVKDGPALAPDGKDKSPLVHVRKPPGSLPDRDPGPPRNHAGLLGDKRQVQRERRVFRGEQPPEGPQSTPLSVLG